MKRVARWGTGVVLSMFLLYGCGKQVISSVEGPQIVTMAPSSAQSYVAADQVFTVAFSEPMDASSVEANFAVTASQKPVSGTYSWSDDMTSMTFRPDAAFAPNSEVSVQMGQGIRSRRGQPLVGQDGQALGAFGFSCTAYASPTTYASNGQRIYFTGTSDSGDPITFVMGNTAVNTGSQTRTGATMGGMGSGGMMGGNSPMGGYAHSGMACVTCHGADGRGGQYLAMGTVVTPDIRYSVLTGADATAEHDHAPYTDETLKQAITQGIEPNGESLNAYMPRWSMSDADFSALLAFLKSL